MPNQFAPLLNTGGLLQRCRLIIMRSFYVPLDEAEAG